MLQFWMLVSKFCLRSLGCGHFFFLFSQASCGGEDSCYSKISYWCSEAVFGLAFLACSAENDPQEMVNKSCSKQRSSPLML